MLSSSRFTPSSLFNEYFADVAEGVAGVVEQFNHGDALDGAGIEEALMAGGDLRGGDDADHEVVLELGGGNAGGFRGVGESEHVGRFFHYQSVYLLEGARGSHLQWNTFL